MELKRFTSPKDFLEVVKPTLLSEEAANSLMLGIVLDLAKSPHRYKLTPYLAAVTSEDRLISAAVMTPPRNLILYCAGVDPGKKALRLIVQDLLDEHWNVPGVLGRVEIANQFGDIWTQLAGGSVRQGMRQRVYELLDVISPDKASGSMRVATDVDRELVSRWTIAFHEEAVHDANIEMAKEVAERKVANRDVYLWEDDGQPVSMAARVRPVLHGISISMVYTPPELRCRGYASNLVAAFSQYLLDSGWTFCALFTDLDFSTSNHIYQAIGYQSVCDFTELIFTN